MELYSVTVSYMPPHLISEWETRMREHVRRQPSASFNEPRPSPVEVTRYAAAHGGFDAEPIAEASRLALGSVVGPPDSWERFQAFVLSVAYVGSVALNPTAVAEGVNDGSIVSNV